MMTVKKQNLWSLQRRQQRRRRRRQRQRLGLVVVLWSGVMTTTTKMMRTASAFDVMTPTTQSTIQSIVSFHPLTVASSLPSAATATASSSLAVVKNLNPALAYMNVLTHFPLATKMVTGATLAVAGDAIAQHATSTSTSTTTTTTTTTTAAPYDRRRAASFAVFDAAYRALQHVAYPAIVAYFHGQFLCSAASLVLAQYYLPLDVAAGLERTLCSQLVIVPFLYYPVFFTLTAALQGLDWQAGFARAQAMFVPLMARNLLFWIPAQYIQFSAVPADLQIPFGSLCGLVWTFCLSVLAGAAVTTTTKTTTTGSDVTTTDESSELDNNEDPYCVIGVEDHCQLPPDLFPHATFDDITHELEHEMQEIANFILDQHDNDDDDDDDVKYNDENEYSKGDAVTKHANR